MNHNLPADFVAIARDNRLSANLVSHDRDTAIVTFDVRAGDLPRGRFAIELDEFINELGRRCNEALAHLGTMTRIYELRTDSDFHAFLACSADAARRLASAGTEMWILPWTREDEIRKFSASQDPANDWSDL